MRFAGKTVLFASAAIFVVAAVFWRSDRKADEGFGAVTESAGMAEGARQAPPEEDILAEAMKSGSGTSLRFGSISENLVEGLQGVFTGAARRVRYAEEMPGFLDPKTSPLLAYPDGRVLELELFEDLTIPIVLTATHVSRSGAQVVEGIVPGHPGSRFMMTASGGAASISIEVSPDDRYVVNALGEGTYEILELDPMAVPPCASPRFVFIDADALAVLAARAGDREERAMGQSMAQASNPAAHAVIDLLMVYSSDVAAGHSFLSIRNKAELAVAEGNSDFERSGARVRLRLVGLEEVEYEENGSNSDALARLRRTNDGYLDTVHGLRDNLGADLVCLLQEKRDDSSSGIAYVMNKAGDQFSELFGFSVVEYQYLTGLNTMVHEIGHNLGCNHDRENAGNAPLYPFSYGYRFMAGNGQTYRTIMA